MRFKKFYLIATTTLLIVMTPILIMTIITLGNNLKDRISDEETKVSSEVQSAMPNSDFFRIAPTFTPVPTYTPAPLQNQTPTPQPTPTPDSQITLPTPTATPEKVIQNNAIIIDQWDSYKTYRIKVITNEYYLNNFGVETSGKKFRDFIVKIDPSFSRYKSLRFAISYTEPDSFITV